MSEAVRAEKLKIELATEHLVKTPSFPQILLHIFLNNSFQKYSPHLFLQLIT